MSSSCWPKEVVVLSQNIGIGGLSPRVTMGVRGWVRSAGAVFGPINQMATMIEPLLNKHNAPAMSHSYPIPGTRRPATRLIHINGSAAIRRNETEKKFDMIKKTIRRITIGTLLAAVASFVTPLHAENEKPGEESIVRVMTYNACRGGTYQGQPLSQSAKMIQMAQADIVGLQEIGENVPKLAKLLGWNHCGPFLTRYEIVEEIKGISRRPSDGMKVKLPSGQEAYVFNLHLPHGPFQPYQLLGLTAGYRVYPKIDTEAEAIAGAKKTRGRFITRLFKRIAALSDKEAPIFVVGDFNEPSHLDWTEAAAKAGRHPMKVEFPNSLTMAQAGFVDAYRTVYPDEMEKPGFTWTPLKKADDPEIHHDRIDYVYYKGKGVKVTDAKVIGESKENADIVVSPYPSDHRAVVATFTLPNQPK